MSFQQNENRLLYLHYAVLAWIFHLLLRKCLLFLRGRMGENLKISIFFGSPQLQFKSFLKNAKTQLFCLIKCIICA